MSNIVPFEANTNVSIPQHLAALFGGGNIALGDGFPSISVKGKVFTINKDGNKTGLMTKDAEGNEFPTPSIKVVVLGQTPGRSRTFYEGSFTDDSTAKPSCHSYDGIKPATDSESPQCATCAACEQSVKGSKISEEGNATTACAVNKLLVVAPSNKVTLDNLFRMRLAVTSLYDKDNPEEAKGWYPWDLFLKFLKSRGVAHTAMVETSIKFDPKAAYPKLLFRASGMLSEDMMGNVAEVAKADEINQYLGLDKAHAEVTEAKAIAKPVAQVEKPKADDNGFGGEPEVKAEVKPRKKAEPKVEAKVEAKPEIVAESKPPVTVVEDDGDLASALANWD